MALVTGPLHSQSASGQFGKTLIFQESMRRHVVKAYGKPNWTVHPPSAAQLAIQALTKKLMQHWEEISLVDQATWDALATPAQVSRVNSYLKENYARYRSGRAMLEAWPDTTTTLIPTITLLDPDNGAEAGMEIIAITGTNFLRATAVDFGTEPSGDVTIVSDTEIHAETPPWAFCGPVNVMVTTPDGVNIDDDHNIFTYNAP